MEIVGAAQHPLEWPWPDNTDGPRTMAQAVELARKVGVVIPEDVEFIEDEWGLIKDEHVEARYVRWEPLPGQTIAGSAFYTHTGRIPVLLRTRVLRSAAARVAVMGHEMHELNNLRELFAASGGVMLAQRSRELVGLGIPRNLHDQAWDVADELVRKMRSRQ